MGAELILMRSRTAMRCGEMKSPVLRGVFFVRWYWERMESTKAHVLPLPFVPATWTMFRRSRSAAWALKFLVSMVLHVSSEGYAMRPMALTV
jgi:hypothetical protein